LAQHTAITQRINYKNNLSIYTLMSLKSIWDSLTGLFDKKDPMPLITLLGRISNANSTHEDITRIAIEVLIAEKLANIDKTTTDWLIEASNDPDEKPTDLWAGHFYGEIPDGKMGSYLSFRFAGQELNAMNNFEMWYDDVLEHATKHQLQEKAVAAGSALHYMQDMTAPHHFHNLPAKLSDLMYGWDTHSAFEKRAKELIISRDYREAALIEYKALPEFDLPEDFGRVIHERALKIAPDFRKLEDSKEWDAIIDQLLPLAIGGTMRLLEVLY
jgi:hypothetical protein